uniref:Transposase n=1 Tax=Globodera rostochiensis TaxID=31243 RepID=A0A914H8P3_GLORO
MSITKSTDRTPKLDKLNPIQLISLDKLNPIQLINLDNLNPIQLISLDKLNPIQLIKLLNMSENELGLCFKTISNWKRELGQTKPQHIYSDSEQKELMKRYYEIKDQNTKMSVGDIAKNLKICRATLYIWKKLFDRQQMHPSSVDGHSVEENAVANVQKIGNSNSGSI